MGLATARSSPRPARGDRPTLRFGPPVADAIALGSLLAGLHGALSAPHAGGTVVGSAAFAEETRALASRLGALLDGLRGIDPQLLRAVPTSAPPAFAEVDHLGATVSAIRNGWRRHVQSRFEGAKGGALWGLKDRQGVEILAVMNKLDNENAHSDVIRWLLDPQVARNVAPPALLKLVEVLEDAAEWKKRITEAIARGALAVRREVVIGLDGEDPSALDRIDLVISGPGLLLAIENKVWSHEHDGQTETYAAWLEGFRGERIVGGVFLTPDGHSPASAGFRPVSYVDLLDCLLEGPSTRKLDPREALVLSGYVKSLASSVLRDYLRHL